MPSLAQTAGLFTHAGFAIAGAAAVSIPIIIHLLTRIKRRPVQWGAMKFLLEAYRKHRKRLQLEQWLLLLVRCLVLFLLGMALAGPLMGGCAQKLGVDSSGRIICLIIDDGLTGQTYTTDNTELQRFERQRDIALRMIDGLSSADQVALFRTARPAQATVAPPTIDRGSVRRIVENMKPRAARSDLVGAIKEAKAVLVEKASPADRSFIVLLSDFAHGSIPLDQPMPAESAQLDQLARILVTKPMATAGNVQIARFTPRRHLILTGAYASEGPPRIPVEIELRRFNDDQAARVTKVQFALIMDDPAKPLAVFQTEEVRWPVPGTGGSGASATDGVADDNKMLLQRDLILAPETLEALNLGPSLGGRLSAATVILRATIEPDALMPDNQRYATVELRQRLRVAVAGDASLVATPGDNQMTPGKWMAIGLAPALDLGALEVTELPAFDLDDRKLATLDAVMVLRPDQLSDAGWKALHDLASRGGMVWIFTPPTDAPATWGDALRTRMGLNWNLAIDPVVVNKPDAPGSPGSVAPGVPPDALDASIATAESQGLSLALDKPPPQLMYRLSADWSDLLRPVQVYKRLPITVPGGAGNDAVWLWTEDGQPLLVAGAVGDGAVFLLTTALDVTWTTLPTRPLMIPLLHETLANVQARSAEAARLSGILSGDQPQLTRTWEEVTQLERMMGGDDGAMDVSVLLRRTDEGFTPASPLDEPGVYRASPAAQGRVLAVNIDPVAGDTTAIEEKQLEAWLAALGATTYMDENNPAAALASFESRANIGQLLLWITLAFLVTELFLARRFSHAHTGAPHTMIGVGASLYNRFVGKR